MIEALMTVAILPLWLASAVGWCIALACHALTGGLRP